MATLSVIIPARNEMFLSKTVEDLLANIRGDTEIICVADGNWPNPPVKDNPKVTMIYHSQSIGQRAACNEAAKLSRAKYIAKCDAHCSFDEGFDVKLMEKMEDNWTVAPVMRNLYCHDWVCEKGHRRYQGPEGPCKECGAPTQRDIKWIAKTNPQSTAYCIDPVPHFQYMNEMKQRPEYKKSRDETGLTETFSLQGSFFMMTRKKYFELGINDESWGSWGTQGAEVAIKTWTSGGKVMIVHSTWHSHMFRTQSGPGWGFPYPISGRQVEKAKKTAKKLFFESKWGPKQIYPLSWLVERFWPIKFWTDEDLKQLKKSESKFWTSNDTFFDTNFVSNVSSTQPEVAVTTEETQPKIHCISSIENMDISTPKSDTKRSNSLTKGIVYYTDNRLDAKIMSAVQTHLLRIRTKSISSIVSVALKNGVLGATDFADKNIVLELPRGPLTMFKQILAGLEAVNTDIIYLVEHDCLYPVCHFEFTPDRKDFFYYNENWWKVRVSDGQALQFRAKQLSGICGYTEMFIDHFRKRVARVEKDGFTLRMGYEPGTYSPPRGFDDYKHNVWFSEKPYIDIRHDNNATPTRYRPEEFRHQVVNWKMSDEVPGWGRTKDRFNEFMQEVRGYKEEEIKPMTENSNGLHVETEKDMETEIVTSPNTSSLPSRGIIYYSDCQLAPEILEPCQKQLLRCANGHQIVSVTLKPMDFGENYTLPLERSVLTMFKQILEAIKRSTADILFFTEHDCLYTKEHFQFTPSRKDVYYFNENQWQVDANTGRALFYHCMRLSTMCAYRELVLEHYTKRVERVEKEGFTLRMGYEPGGHKYPRGVDNYGRERFMTPYPLIDLRHTGTVSPSRWKKANFRNQNPLWAWSEAEEIPYWGRTQGRMKEFLEALK